MLKQKICGQLAWVWLSLGVFALDWLTKTWISQNLAYGELWPITPFLDFTLLHNTGAAFSFLADQSGWQRWFFIGIACLTIVILLVWLARLSKQDTLVAIALALILGGALGNVYDRWLLGYVVDFIALHWQQKYFPAFNVADMAISLGALMMAYDALWPKTSVASSRASSTQETPP
ncbi:signal peptidase II [Allopseudospirillum japonicum]|uniref:Lipoprotein signal peptidase n=1 Tax=Allopseudospirillum japonicum TaxID=64971 RepID=A0A1H6SVK0_9GAMM|nr:signal peptidase II [Allopseudospirillum japonicum]SEI68070.1 signal peptidase II [Allopseudospirillum japonicum]